MITVTKQQMIDFCFAQPDDRKVDFFANEIGDDCGCVMVHYGAAHNITFESCGLQSWVDGIGNEVARLEAEVFYNSFRHSMICTYGDIKKFLLDKNWLPTVVD